MLGSIGCLHVITVDINFYHLIKIVFPRHVHYKVTIFSFPYFILQKQVNRFSPHSSEGLLQLGHYLLSAVLPGRRFASSLLFIYLFNHLFTAVWTCVYFILLVIIQYHVIYFNAQIISTVAIGCFQFGSCILAFFLFFVEYFFLSIRCSSYSFLALRIWYFSKEPFSFICEWHLKPRSGCQVCLLLLVSHCLQAFSVDRAK